MTINVDLTTSPITVDVVSGVVGSSSSGAGLSVVFDTAGVASGNVYTTWATAVAALAALPDGRKDLYVRTSATIPTGAWDLNDTTVHGNGAFNSPVVLTVPNGATITGWNRLAIEGGITVDYSGSGSMTTIATAPHQVYAENDAAFKASGTGNCFLVTSTNAELVLFTLRYGGGFFTDGVTTGHVLNYTGTGSTIVVALPVGNARVYPDTIASTTDSINLVVLASAANSAGYGGILIDAMTQPDATMNKILATDARNVGYTPTTSADWATVPDDVGEALDTLAGKAGSVYTIGRSTSTPAALLANADFVCSSSSTVGTDINTAITTVQALTNGGTLRFLPGTYTINETVLVPDGNKITLEFDAGAKLTGTSGFTSGATATTAYIKVENSDTLLVSPAIDGPGDLSSTTVGIALGGDSTYGGVGDTVYRCGVISPDITQCQAGIVFGINAGNSSGDNWVQGGYIRNCDYGVHSIGFVNRLTDVTIADCNYSIYGASTRSSHRIDVVGCTLNSWNTVCIQLDGGKGSTFTDIWAERGGVYGAGATAFARIGSAGAKCTNVRFLGTTNVHLCASPQDTHAFDLVNADNLYIEDLAFSTNGGLPTGNYFNTTGATNTTPKVTVGRFNFSPGTVPAWTTAMIADTFTNLDILEMPFPPGATSTYKGNTVGKQSGSPADYTIFKDSSWTLPIYYAKNQRGGIVAYGYDVAATTSGLLTVLEALELAGLSNKHVHFSAGTFRFMDDVQDQDHWPCGSGSTSAPILGLTLSGEGMGATIIQNDTNVVSGDTEPFSFTNCTRVTVRDFTIEGGGPYRGTTDALDFDHCNHCLVERVEVRRSRSRGIVFDGGDASKTSFANTVRNCIIRGRPAAPQLNVSTSGGSGLTSGTTFRYMVTFTDQDLGETRPSEITEFTSANSASSVTVKFETGPVCTTARNIYRRSGTGGSLTWDLIATVADNTTTTYLDTGAAGTPTTIATAGVRNGHQIPQYGIEFLGADSCVAEGNYIDGVGSENAETSGAGIAITAKSSTKPSSRCIVRDNTIRFTYAAGIKVGGSNYTQVTGNNILNPGWPSAGGGGQHPGIRVITDSSIAPLETVITNNWCGDNRNNNMLGASSSSLTRMKGGVEVTNGTNTVVMGNVFHAGYDGATVTWFVDTGTTSFFGTGASGTTVGRQGDNHHMAVIP